MAASVVTVPPTPTNRPPTGAGTPSARPSPRSACHKGASPCSMAAARWHQSSAETGSARTAASVMRTAPTSALARATTWPCAVPRTTSVLPPPTSTIQTSLAAPVPSPSPATEARPRTAPIKDSAASPGPLKMYTGRPVVRSTSRQKSARSRASRRALVPAMTMSLACMSRACWASSATAATVRAAASGANRRSRSTPWPRRVRRSARLTATTVSPRTSATSRRTELVPMSMAAQRPPKAAPIVLRLLLHRAPAPTVVGALQRHPGLPQLLLHGAPDRVVPAADMVGVVGVQALHPGPRADAPNAGFREGLPKARVVALEGVPPLGRYPAHPIRRGTGMALSQRLHEGGVLGQALFVAADPALRFQPANGRHKQGTRQPVHGGENIPAV